MTKEITESGEWAAKLQTKRVTVKGGYSDQIKDMIPPSKVFLVYVNYNEGNLILERDNQGLRRRTVKYLLETGAIVFIVYCLEKSSENLLDEMYAQKLSSISYDSMLKNFSAKKRILSIYKKYSRHQLVAICQQINNFNKEILEKD
ncbi:uncharacterized protein LOC134271934 [Saccostrea cucullata]|uniref:uncharacterized protein LOC134271934 n=1 Tax=Saccostrea cuccullata TaxID=36930 RepID=UPI002ED373F8